MGPRQRHRRLHAKTHIAPIIIGSFFGFMLLTGVAFGVGMIGVIDSWLQDLPDYTNTDLYLSSAPTTILEGCRLSQRAWPSRRNSGEKRILGSLLSSRILSV